MQGLGSYPLVMAGSREQKEAYLPKIGTGQLLATYALTEAEAGSDVNGMKSRGEETPEGFALTGKKRFISRPSRVVYFIILMKLYVVLRQKHTGIAPNARKR